MKSKVAEFRRVAEQRRKQGRSARYSDNERRFATAHARKQLQAGGSLQGAARELGVAGQTLTYWLRTEEDTRVRAVSSQPRLVTVVTRAEPMSEPAKERAAIVLVTGAVRVELSDLELATELARRLR